MTNMRALLCLILMLTFALPVTAQEASEPDRAATGGAQTLEDILARQRGEKIDLGLRRPATGLTGGDSVPGIVEPLGTLGAASDADVWRALRHNATDVTVSAGGDTAKVLVQDSGMTWLQVRAGPVRTYGGWLLLGTIGLLALFFLVRGRIRLDEPLTGRKVLRFRAIERFAHWLMAGSFIVLAITGLLELYGRVAIEPYFGKEVNAMLLAGSKWLHNNIAWAFMLGLVMAFVMWVAHNIPDRTDLVWLRQFGGIIGKKHPPAKKFNAGQKLIFWSVMLLGGSIAVSGLSLLFPFELPLFAKTFSVLNSLGVPGWFGLDPLPTVLAPHQEMQLAQLWHAIVAFVLTAIILGHIYIGSIGMEGAFDAMGTGEVDEAWAHQHHSLWLEEMRAAQARPAGKPDAPGASPAE